MIKCVFLFTTWIFIQIHFVVCVSPFFRVGYDVQPIFLGCKYQLNQKSSLQNEHPQFIYTRGKTGCCKRWWHHMLALHTDSLPCNVVVVSYCRCHSQKNIVWDRIKNEQKKEEEMYTPLFDVMTNSNITFSCYGVPALLLMR